MRPADNNPASMGTPSVSQMSLVQLKKLRQESRKLTVYHQSTSDGTDRQVLLEGVSAGLLSAFSPYLQALIQSDTKKMSVTITGGNAAACKELVRYMHKYCDDKDVLPAHFADSELLECFQLHEFADVLQMKTISEWAMAEAETILEQPVTPSDVLAVLSNCNNNRYEGMVRCNLAYCMSAWLGGYSENCQFVKNLEKDHAEFVVHLRRNCEFFNMELRDTWTRKFKALCAEDERVRAEDERKVKQAEKRKANHPKRKNRQRAETVAHQVAQPLRKVSPSPVGSYAAVAAAPVPASRARATTAAPAPKPDTNLISRAHRQSIATASPAKPGATPSRGVAATAETWASIARRSARRPAQ